MLKTFTCGTFHHEEEEDEEYYKSSHFSASPKSKKGKIKNNPYATIGREKFSKLLADLDERRQRIYSQTKNPHDISFVRFVYDGKDDFVPVVVKSKNRDARKHKSEELMKLKHDAPLISETAVESSVKECSRRSLNNKAEKTRVAWNFWRRPSEYLPAVVILILVFLIVFGRSAATLCTCIVWYIVPILPTLKKERSKSRKLEKNMKGDELSPVRHGHRKSW